MEKELSEDKQFQFNKLRCKYPDRVPIIIEESTNIKLKNYKYLVPKDINMSQFLYIIRTNMNIDEKQAIFMFVKNGNNLNSKNSNKDYILVNLNELIENIYNNFKCEDNFLYIKFGIENTFG